MWLEIYSYGYVDMRDRTLKTKRGYLLKTTMITTASKTNIVPMINHSVLVSGRLTGIPCHLKYFIGSPSLLLIG